MGFTRRAEFNWQLRSRGLPLGQRTLVMGILNLTPDSFSGDGLAAKGVDAAVRAGCAALDSGADILDLGAESTRPGAVPISAGHEQERLLPVLQALLHERPEAIISVDTYHASTATAAAALGAEIINDVSGLRWDPAMARAVHATGCGLVLMHTRGRPTEWQTQAAPDQKAVVRTVVQELGEQFDHARETGIPEAAVVLDPGISFGKNGAENFSLLAQLDLLAQLGCPLLVGLSRKGFLGEAVRGVQAMERQQQPVAIARREATLAGNVAAVLAGAHILRVHDVALTREAAAVADAVLAAAQD